FTDNERVEIWKRLLNSNEPLVILGTRTAMFLPFAKLGLVVVDEEHDQSYKQFERAPRYNARDAAIMLAHMHGAFTLLGSATPSIETYYKASIGKYGLVELSKRYKDATLPEIIVTDMSLESKKKAVEGSFALSTIADIRKQVEDGRQVIVFHNRRGFAPMAHCTQCQYIPKCKYCDVTLTYHKNTNALVCHYCGSTYPLPDTCPVCKEPSIEVVGYGTERIADQVESLFPDAKCLRMDLDTTRNKNSYDKMISDFSAHKADILVGTQMVSKGLDFGDVSLAAVVNADAMIHFPDFRSAERSFNILQQVAGRAGRRDNDGKVIIQTRTPSHPVITFVKAQDYKSFYLSEIEERRMFAYPPFARLIYIYLKHKDETELDNISFIYADRLRGLFGTRVTGPTKPSVAKVQLYHIRQIMLKVELNASMAKVKEILKNLHSSLHSSIPSMRQLVIYYDVDPY
ncbi:MAG: primosomal protein N', partial [Muribaculaceae bacterium]|nr:primosomal protein N' [Muribaculaceae bacterium]